MPKDSVLGLLARPLRHHRPGAGILFGILLAIALTGLPRLSATLVAKYLAPPSQGMLLAKRPLFFDKVTGSQFTLARPEGSAMPWAEGHTPEPGTLNPERSEAIVVVPGWPHAVVAVAFWNHTNFV